MKIIPFFPIITSSLWDLKASMVSIDELSTPLRQFWVIFTPVFGFFCAPLLPCTLGNCLVCLTVAPALWIKMTVSRVHLIIFKPFKPFWIQLHTRHPACSISNHSVSAEKSSFQARALHHLGS